MDDGVPETMALMRRRLFTVNSAVAIMAIAALAIALLVGSMVARIICGLIIAAAGVYFFAWWRTMRDPERDAGAVEPITDT